MPERAIQGKTESPVKLTPEQVKAISARVYALLLADLRLERERARTSRTPGKRP